MPKLFALALLTVAALLLMLPLPTVQADEGEKKPAEAKAKEEKPPAAEIDKKVADFTVKDVEGRSFQLHACSITRKQAEAAVFKAAQAYGAAKDATAKTRIDSLSGVKDDDNEVDDSEKVLLACAAGSYFGLTATEDTIGRFKTLGDLIEWIAGANEAPLLFVVWSANCPSVRQQNDRLIEVAAKTGARIFAVASNTRDTNDDVVKYRDAFEFNVRVFPDPAQKVTDILGGKVTPHHFVLDKDAVLRYRGAIDDDPMGYMDDDERQDLLIDAIEALKKGKAVETKESEPAG